MKLNETNSKFAVVITSGHNGGTYAFSNSLVEAEKKAKRYRFTGCTCGCCDVVPITIEARKEMVKHDDRNYRENMSLYNELPEWAPGKYRYYELCR